jgi:L-threonylcarbamoyladenylate synthase
VKSPVARRIPYGAAALAIACDVLRRGGIVVYPTDTLYGLGVDATQDAAVTRLNHLKGRTGPVSVIAADERMVRRWTTLSAGEFDVVRERLGGPTTVILPVRSGIVSPLVLGPDHTLGIRLPGHPCGPELVRRLGVPITTTSVNRSGEPPLNDPDRILAAFGDAIDLLIDDGPLPESTGSIIYTYRKGKLIIIRP